MSDPGPPDAPPQATPVTEPSSDIPLWLILGLVVVMVAAVGLAAFVLLGAKDEKDAPKYPAQWDPRIAPFVKIVEKQRGRTFLHPVEVRFLPPAEFEKEVTADEKDLDDEERKEIEQATGLLRALGLLTGDVDLFEAFNDVHGSGTLAYYSFDDERVTIRGTQLTPSVRSTLIHELTHALQDQSFGVGDRLEKLREKSEDGDSTTELSVLDAIVEGDAKRVETGYRQSLNARQRKALDKSTDEAGNQARKELEHVPKVVLTIVSSPYALGEALLQAVAEDGGNGAVDELFRDSPTDDSALLDPFQVLVGHPAAAEVDVPKLGDGEKKFDAGEFGVLTWYFMLAERLPLLDALAAADGWGGDAYVAYERGGDACARVAYTGEKPQDTTRMLRALQRWVAAAPGAPAAVRADGDRVLFESCDPGTTAKVGNDASLKALELAAIRTYLGIGIMRSGAPEKVARCLAGRLVREYPVSRLSDPKFGARDPAVKARVQQLAAGCR